MKKEDDSHAVLGSFTDFNVWDKVLTEQELRDFTSCSSFMQGNLFPWNSNDWEFTKDIDASGYLVGEVEKNLEFFPDNAVIGKALETCKVFGGKMVITHDEADYEELWKIL